MNQTLHRAVRFGTAFLCSALCVALLFGGLTWADTQMRATAFPENLPIAGLRMVQEPLSFNFALFGRAYQLPLDWLNTAVGYAQPYSCFLPAWVRFVLKLAALPV